MRKIGFGVNVELTDEEFEALVSFYNLFTENAHQQLADMIIARTLVEFDKIIQKALENKIN